MTLTSNYQYIGRSNEVKSYNGKVSYYLLLYAKTVGEGGKHRVSVKLRMASPHDTSFYNWNTTGSASVDGVNAISWSAQPIPNAEWSTAPITEGGVVYKRWVDLQEGSAQVNTGYGAARDVAVAAYWKRLDVSNPTGYLASVTPAEASIPVTLPAIAGASTPTLSASTIEMGKQVTVYTNPLADGFTHRLTYAFGSASGVIAESAGQSVSWTPPVSLARQIPSATAGIGSVYCTTYQNGTPVGEAKSVSFTLTVPESVKPTASLSWQDASGAYDRFGSLVQNVSRLICDITGTGAQGSTIRSAQAALDGVSYNGGVLTKAGVQTLTATVTDSRGRIGSDSKPLSVLAYSVPTVKINASRCNAEGESDDTGEFAKVTVTGSVSDLPGNTARLTFTHGGVTEEQSLSTGAFTQEFILEAPSVATLSLKAVVSDALLTATDAMTLSVGYATMDFLQGGKGIAFGATATREGFTCAMDAYFSGKLCHVSEDGETEWLFPPMQPGVEYRTVRRWRGKPLYTQLVDVGNLPNASTKRVSCAAFTELCDFTAIASTASGGVTLFSDMRKEPWVTGIVAHSGQLQVQTNVDAAGYTAAVQLWYIKDGTHQNQ